ncbi:MAG TPA: isocitrate lyase/PEP mutase family protein [bacterium]|nr:isocitrate lyase/PEP mutase family protein [bacterium]
MTDHASQFRALLRREDIIVAPICYDPFTARLAEQAGFECIAVGGYAMGAHTCLTEPLLSLDNVADIARRIQSAVGVPVFMDAGAGYGEAINVWHTVRQLEATGIAGLHIEDQVYPKRAHYHRDYREHVIDVEHMKERIQAALEARRNPDFVICARTDAMRTDGFAEGIRRANAYVEAGADMIMCFPNTPEEVRRAPREIPVPVQYVNSHGNRVGRPVLSIAELQAAGYKMVDYATASVLTVYEAVGAMFRRLRQTGDAGMSADQAIAARKGIEDLIGLPTLYAIEERTTERRR